MVPFHLSNLCTRIQAAYHVDELWGYQAGGQDSPQYISIHRVERCGDPHRLPAAQCGSHADVENTECQDAIYGRLLGCETRLFVALVSWQLLADPAVKNSYQYLPWHTKEGNHPLAVTLLGVSFWGNDNACVQSVEMIPVFQMGPNRMSIHTRTAVLPRNIISKSLPLHKSHHE